MENIEKKDMVLETEERKLIDNLDTGVAGNNIDTLVEKVNIPYSYLDEEIRGNINNIFTEFIKPNLQDALRMKKESKIFRKPIREALDKINPEKMSIDIFLKDLKSTYVEKINLQSTISDFLREFINRPESLSQIEDKDKLTKQGIKLYNKSLKVEPLYFAYSSKIKEFIEYCNKNYFEKALVSSDDNLMLLTPSQPSYPFKKELDFSQYRISNKKDRLPIEKKIIKFYFNNEPLYFNKYLKNILKKQPDFFTKDVNKKKEIQSYINKTTENLQSFYIKKSYFLLERKILFAKEVDDLLMIDNCLDKYLEIKLCFLHDLFLKMYLIKWKGGDYKFRIDENNLEETIRMVLNFDDQKLIN